MIRRRSRFVPLVGLAVLGLVGGLSSAALQTQHLDRARSAGPDLTVFRPQHGSGYFPFARTAVPDHLEEDAQLGPGIRVNGAGEVDPAGEDDLIELVVDPGVYAADFGLWRSDPALAVWTTRTKTPGTELSFVGAQSLPIPLVGGRATLWVEWTGAAGATPALELVATTNGRSFDRVVFHAFRSFVVALGGRDQVPSLPVDPNHGTFVTGTALYQAGYDVIMRDEDEVDALGDGLVFDEVVNALTARGVDQLAIFGYSHGGGSTWDLCDRLAMTGGLGSYAIEFTSYTDGVENDSELDTDQEDKFPTASGFHANHYQHGSFFQDLGLDGTAIPGSNPPPSGLDVETTPWGASSTHFDVDDYVQVVDYILVNLESRVAR